MMGIAIYNPQIKNNNAFIFNLNVSSQVQLLHGCFPGCSYSFFLRYFLCLQMQPNVNNQSRGHINTRAYACWVMYDHCRSWCPQKWPKRGLVAPAWNTVCAVKRRRLQSSCSTRLFHSSALVIIFFLTSAHSNTHVPVHHESAKRGSHTFLHIKPPIKHALKST